MMVALTLLCASLAACAEATNPNRQQQQTVSQPTAEAQPEDNAGNVGIDSPDSGRAEKDKEAREGLYPEDESDSHKGNVGIDSPDSGRAEKDKEAREELERQQEEEAERQREEEERQQEEAERQREEEERQQEEQAYSGNGTYILSDGTEVHTEHSIEDYIEKDEYYVKRDGVLTPKYEFILDIGKMCYDIFGGGALETAAGFSFTNDRRSGGVIFSEYDENNLVHAITIDAKDDEDFPTYSIVKMYDCSMPARWWPDDKNTIKVGESYMHLDLAVLMLYGLEQAKDNPKRNIFADIPFVSNYDYKESRHW